MRRRFLNFAERRKVWIWGIGSFLTTWLVVGVTTFALSGPNKLYFIPTGSMAPTIRPGDRVAVREGTGQRPKRGEIWVFRMPRASKNFPSHALKRVIGLPGETLEVKGGQVFVDGRPLSEPYLAAPMTYTTPPLTLGIDEFFLLGDSRNSSQDSHVWGPLPGDHLVGPFKMRAWPLVRFDGL